MVFFMMIRPPPRSTPFPTRRSSDLTLTTILDEARITRIDYLSMDIEREEPKALAGFDITRFRPKLVCIEGHLPRSEEHTSELQSLAYLVCRLLLEKKKHIQRVRRLL